MKGSGMDVSIVHTGVRVQPEMVVEIIATVDGKAVRVDLERDAIDHLFGADVGDEKAMYMALQGRAEMIRIAIESYVLARGVPMDRSFVLAWRDFEGLADERSSAEVPAR
jgi:RecJ-like exonuclease